MRKKSDLRVRCRAKRSVIRGVRRSYGGYREGPVFRAGMRLAWVFELVGVESFSSWISFWFPLTTLKGVPARNEALLNLQRSVFDRLSSRDATGRPRLLDQLGDLLRPGFLDLWLSPFCRKSRTDPRISAGNGSTYPNM